MARLILSKIVDHCVVSRWSVRKNVSDKRNLYDCIRFFFTYFTSLRSWRKLFSRILKKRKNKNYTYYSFFNYFIIQIRKIDESKIFNNFKSFEKERKIRAISNFENQLFLFRETSEEEARNRAKFYLRIRELGMEFLGRNRKERAKLITGEILWARETDGVMNVYSLLCATAIFIVSFIC